MISKRKLILTACLILISLFMTASLFAFFTYLPVNIFTDPKSGIIVIDPGHGGIDGGTNKYGVLEKETNLEISKKVIK